MEPFTTLEAIAVPIDIANCDTDQIIPARFMRYLPEDDCDYASFLFHDLRFDGKGNQRAGFAFDETGFRGARIIVADHNWGCGSSRENAVYALLANDIRCVIAPSFGDIHHGNCLQHGVLPVRLAPAICDALRADLHAGPGARIAVDLLERTVVAPDGTVHRFEIADSDRHRLLNGLDDIGVTLGLETDIEAYEKRHFDEYDWLSTEP